MSEIGAVFVNLFPKTRPGGSYSEVVGHPSQPALWLQCATLHNSRLYIKWRKALVDEIFLKVDKKSGRAIALLAMIVFLPPDENYDGQAGFVDYQACTVLELYIVLCMFNNIKHTVLMINK